MNFLAKTYGRPVVCFAALWDKPKNLTPKSQAKIKTSFPCIPIFNNF